jgi:hypothetical protein
MSTIQPIQTRDVAAYDNYSPRRNLIARQALDKIRIIADAIRDAKSIPSGHLYAIVMGAFSLEEYERIIQTLKNAKLVYESTAHMLIWEGPK